MTCEKSASAKFIWKQWMLVLIKKDGKVSFSASKENIERLGFVELKKKRNNFINQQDLMMINVIQVFY